MEPLLSPREAFQRPQVEEWFSTVEGSFTVPHWCMIMYIYKRSIYIYIRDDICPDREYIYIMYIKHIHVNMYLLSHENAFLKSRMCICF